MSGAVLDQQPIGPHDIADVAQVDQCVAPQITHLPTRDEQPFIVGIQRCIVGIEPRSKADYP